MIKQLIRLLMKIGVVIISLSLALTSVIGLLSVAKVFSNPDSFQLPSDPGQFHMEFGPLGSNLSLWIGFNNTGYFEFTNFNVEVGISLKNLTSSEKFDVLNKSVFNDDLAPGQFHNLTLHASDADFDWSPYFLDNADSWYESDIQAMIDSNGTYSFPGKESLFYPYLLLNYNVSLSIKIQSDYNLRLIHFAVNLNDIQTIQYSDLFGPTDYINLKNGLIALWTAEGGI
jgi:hypothetical protein